MPKATPVKIRFLFTIRRPLFLKKKEAISAGVPFNKSIQYKKLYGFDECLTPMPSTNV